MVERLTFPDFDAGLTEVRVPVKGVVFDKDYTLVCEAMYRDVEKVELESETLFERRVNLIKGRRELLRELKEAGLKIGVLTNDFSMAAEETVLSLGLSGFVDAVMGNGDMKEGMKPNPPAFLKMCSLLELKPEECIMVGDDLLDDVMGAQLSGMRSIYIPYGDFKLRFGNMNPFPLRYSRDEAAVPFHVQPTMILLTDVSLNVENIKSL